MTDHINIKLDNSDLVASADGATEALRGLKAIVSSLDQSSASKLTASIGGLSTAIAALNADADKFQKATRESLSKASVDYESIVKRSLSASQALAQSYAAKAADSMRVERLARAKALAAEQAAQSAALARGLAEYQEYMNKRAVIAARVLPTALPGRSGSLWGSVSKVTQEQLAEQARLETLRTTLLERAVGNNTLEQQAVAKAGTLRAERLASAEGSAAVLDLYRAQYAEQARLETLRTTLLERAAGNNTLEQQVVAKSTWINSQRLASAEGSAAAISAMGVQYAREERLALVRERILGTKQRLLAAEASQALQERARQGSSHSLADLRRDYLAAGYTSNYPTPAGTASSSASALASSSAASSGNRALMREMNEMHSATRGLASGLGAMWLTWGSILPLMAGAAVSHAIVKAVKLGAEVGQSLATIQHLGGASTEEIKRLNTALLDTADSGPFGPKETAKALQTLALAGFNANEQISALKPVLDFSIAGGMPIEKAAESLVAISTAFGYQARDMSVVSDLVSKTAAVSMSTVEGMSASFKIAATIAQQYNASLIDVSATLGLLSNVGIKGTSAGTAVKEMYNDLIGKSKEARKMLKETLDFSAFEGTGKDQVFKPLSQSMEELSKSFLKLDLAGQAKALQTMAGERGAKGFATFFAAMRSDMRKTGETKDEFLTKMKEMYADLENAPGFSALAAIGMSGTTENQIKQTVSTLQVALVKAFQEVEPAVLRVTALLQDMFKSDSFNSGLSSMISGTADLVRWIVSHADVLGTLVKGYVVYTATTAAASLVTALMGTNLARTAVGAAASALSFAGVTVTAGTTAAALLGVTAASGGVITALGLMNAAAGILGVIAVLATAAYTAYMLFSDAKAATGDDDLQRAEGLRAATDMTISGMDRELERLDELIAAKGDLKKADKLQAEAARNHARDKIEDEIETRKKVLETAVAEQVKAESTLFSWRSGLKMLGFQADDPEKVTKARTELAAAEGLMKEQEEKFDRLLARSKEYAVIVEARKRAGPTSGTTELNTDKGKDDRARAIRAEYDVGLTLTKAYAAARLSIETQALKDEDAMLTARRDALIISQGEFMVRDLEQVYKHEAAKAATIQQTRDDAAADLIRQSGKAQELLDKSRGDNAGKKGADVVDARALQTYNDTVNKATDAVKKLNIEQDALSSNNAAEALSLRRLALVALTGEINKADAAYKEFLRTESETAAKNVRATALDDANRNAPASTQAFNSAVSAEYERLTAKVAEYDVALAKSQESMDASNRALAEQIRLYGDMSPLVQTSVELINKRNEALLAEKAIRDAVQASVDGKAFGAGIDAKIKSLSDSVVVDPFSAWGSTLEATFGSAAKGMSAMVGAAGKLSKSNDEYMDGMADVAKLRKGGTDDIKKAAKLEDLLVAKSTSAQLGAYAEIAGAAKGYFDEKSDAYRLLNGLEMAFHLVEMYNMAEKLALKMGWITASVTGNAAVAASGVASDAIQLPSAILLAQARGLAAVANQGNGDPYSAFPRIAAMIGIMAGLGLLMSGGGGTSVSTDEFSAMSANTGTGTVSGDVNAQSKSIENSLSALESMAKPELAFTSQMVSLLQGIKDGLSGTTNAILSTGFDLTGASFTGSSEASGNWLFGKNSSSSTLTDLGLSFGKQTVDQARRGVDLQKYQTVRTDSSSSGFLGFGGGSSSDTRTTFSDADTDGRISSNMGSVISKMYDTVTVAGKKVGASAAQLASIGDIDLGLGKVSFKGKTGTEVTELLSSVFSAAGDKMALAIMPTLTEFNKAGTGYFETLLMVTAGMEEAAYYSAKLGIAETTLTDLKNKQGDVGAELLRQSITTAETAQGALSGVGDIIANFNGGASELADLYTGLLDVRTALKTLGFSAGVVTTSLLRGAGGLDALQSGLSDFASGFLTESEQRALKQAKMDAEFAKLGMTTPKTAAEFKKLVLGLRDGGEASAELLGRVIVLSGGMADLADSIESTYTSVLDVLQTAVDAQKDLLTKAYDEATSAAQDSLDAVSASVTKLKTLADSLSSTLNGMRITGSEGSYRASAQSAISDALATARAGGGLPVDGELTSALATVSKPSESLYATFEEYALDFYRTANDISALNDLTGEQLTADELTQSILQLQLTQLKTTYEAEVERLDGLVITAKAQLDAAYGISASVMSVADALALINETISGLLPEGAASGAAASATASATGSSAVIVGGSGGEQAAAYDGYRTETYLGGYGSVYSNVTDEPAVARLDSIQEYVRTLGWGSPELDKASSITLARVSAEYGITQTDIASAMNLPYQGVVEMFASAGIPKFEVGTDFVPHDMIAQIHKGEQIVPRAYNPHANQQGPDQDDAVVAELRAILVEVVAVKESNKKIADTLVRVTLGGDAMQTQAYTA
jgi:TP901 family phage tail tape measure protein